MGLSTLSELHARSMSNISALGSRHHVSRITHVGEGGVSRVLCTRGVAAEPAVDIVVGDVGIALRAWRWPA